ncbi:MAG: hypothetical protein ACTSUE_05705 [Promethearchaeota archaeon]
MAKILQDIWILKEDGIVIFQHIFDKEKMNTQLFGGFMSALNTFASQLDENGLSNFELGAKKFTIIKHNRLIFIGNYDKKQKAKKASEELKDVINKFFNTFAFDDIINWVGDLGFFKNFEDVIKDSLEDVVGSLKDSLW